MKIHNRMTEIGRTPYGEENTEPSQTIPSQSYTIQELLEKHTRGIVPQNVLRAASYTENPDWDSPDLGKLSRLDVTDKEVVKTRVKARQTNLLDEIETREKATKKVEKATNDDKTTNSQNDDKEKPTE